MRTVADSLEKGHCPYLANGQKPPSVKMADQKRNINSPWVSTWNVSRDYRIYYFIAGHGGK